MILPATTSANSLQPIQAFSELAFAHNYDGASMRLQASLKSTPQDFVVKEKLGYALSGHGEHLWCWVEKIAQNTDWVAEQLAQWVGISKHHVGYAGRKDKWAQTLQWFSLYLPGRADPDLTSFKATGVRILEMCRHQKKCQRGALAGNYFEIWLRDIESIDKTLSAHDMQADLQQRLTTLAQEGVPNYFGEQRFGHQAQNLIQGERLLCSPNKNTQRRKRQSNSQQGLYISALRSWMFNHLLSYRIKQGNWQTVLPGEVLQWPGSNQWFVNDPSQTTATQISLQDRVAAGDLFITGPLYGDNALHSLAEVATIEQTIGEQYALWWEGLKANRVQSDRRALTLLPQQFYWQFKRQGIAGTKAGVGLTALQLEPEKQYHEALDCQLSFFLPKGSFATMVIRELLA